MHSTTLILGGCRSGKSRYALSLGNSYPGQRKLFVATCEPRDAEMRARIERHQRERGTHWQTRESPIDLVALLARQAEGTDLILVDCLTLWISNLLLTLDNDDLVQDHVDRLCGILSTPPCPIILVSNEVGAGIVPENPLARRFRDLTGSANQKTAAACGQVVWMVAGIAVPIKTGTVGPSGTGGAAVEENS